MRHRPARIVGHCRASNAPFIVKKALDVETSGTQVLAFHRKRGVDDSARALLPGGRGELCSRLRLIQRHLGILNLAVKFCRCSKRATVVVQCFGVILASKDCATIFPPRTTKVSVADS